MFKQGLPERFRKPKGWLWGHFEAARAGVLRFGKSAPHKKPLAHIVYIEGLSEYAEKKFELARDFNDMACNFSVIDRYGQGKSTRYLKDLHKQHSDGTDSDVDDIIQYCKTHIPEGEPIVLLGHSTGGLLVLIALEKAPELFQAAIITSPLLGFESSILRDKEELFANMPLPRIIKESYILGGTTWKPRNEHKDTIEETSIFSSDPKRAAISDYWAAKDKYLQAGDPTIGWGIQMCQAMMKVRNPSFLNNIKKPVFVFTAGQDDLVNNRHIFKAITHIQQVEHHLYVGGKHELLMETDDIRNDLLSKTHKFLKKHL